MGKLVKPPLSNLDYLDDEANRPIIRKFLVELTQVHEKLKELKGISLHIPLHRNFGFYFVRIVLTRVAS